MKLLTKIDKKWQKFPHCRYYKCFFVSNETDEICSHNLYYNEKRLLFPKFILLSNFHCSIRMYFLKLKILTRLINGGPFQKTECHDIKKKSCKCFFLNGKKVCILGLVEIVLFFLKGKTLCFPMKPHNHLCLYPKCFDCKNAQFFLWQMIKMSNRSNILAQKRSSEKCWKIKMQQRYSKNEKEFKVFSYPRRLYILFSSDFT